MSAPTSGPEPGPLLDVTVRHDRDVAGALDGGADALTLLVPDDEWGRSPDLATASTVLRAAPVPVRVMLRLSDGLSTTGGELVRLVGLAEEYLALGAEGVVLGFLDADLEVDVATCAALLERLPGVPWTFHRGFDAALDPRRAWRRVTELPGLTAVETGGSPQGLAQGLDDLLATAEADPARAAMVAASGGLAPEMVPWLARAGVHRFRVAEQVRPGGSERSYVDAGFVRSWRRVLDGAVGLGARGA